ncbi:MAG: hypothetical protein U0228_14460 [Myxococcaceae bacterium]
MVFEDVVRVVVGSWATLIAGAGAISAASAIEDDDQLNLPRRVRLTLLKTAAALVVPALVIFLTFWSTASTAQSGIMSQQLGLCFFGVIAFLVLGAVTTGLLLAGFVGASVARNMPNPWLAAVVQFTITSAGAPLMLLWVALRAKGVI